jgi:DNA-binding FadR family transcriptional regulator
MAPPRAVEGLTVSEDEGLRPVRVAAIHELVVDEIRRAVEMWIYRPGDYLPSERDMAEAMAVSRNTVRTATAILEREGFLSVRRGRGGGYLVEDPARSENRGDEIRRRPEDVQRVWDYRIAVEVGAARLAAEHRTAGDLRELKRLLGKLDPAYRAYERDETLDNARLVQALDSHFHVAMARSTGNPFIVDAVLDARRRLWIAYSSYLTRLDPDSEQRREGIVDAIAQRDAELCERLMRSHLSAGRAQFDRWLVDERTEAPRLAAEA